MAEQGRELLQVGGRHRRRLSRCARRQAAEVGELPGRDEPHRPRRRRVVHLDLVVHAGVGDMDALRVALVEHRQAAVRELRCLRPLARRLELDGRKRARERVGRDRQVRLVAPSCSRPPVGSGRRSPHSTSVSARTCYPTSARARRRGARPTPRGSRARPGRLRPPRPGPGWKAGSSSRTSNQTTNPAARASATIAPSRRRGERSEREEKRARLEERAAAASSAGADRLTGGSAGWVLAASPMSRPDITSPPGWRDGTAASTAGPRTSHKGWRPSRPTSPSCTPRVGPATASRGSGSTSRHGRVRRRSRLHEPLSG